MRLYRMLTHMTTLGALDVRSAKQRTRSPIRWTGPARERPPVERDEADRAYIAELQTRAAVALGYVMRMGSTDPDIRSAAHTEWNAEHGFETA